MEGPAIHIPDERKSILLDKLEGALYTTRGLLSA